MQPEPQTPLGYFPSNHQVIFSKDKPLQASKCNQIFPLLRLLLPQELVPLPWGGIQGLGAVAVLGGKG